MVNSIGEEKTLLIKILLPSDTQIKNNRILTDGRLY